MKILLIYTQKKIKNKNNKFEVKVSDIDSRVKGGYVMDLIIDAESFLSNIDNPLVKQMIPDAIRNNPKGKSIVIDFSLSGDINFFIKKTKKFYQGENRYFLMVHYGEKKDAMVPDISEKITDQGREGFIKFPENIGILTDNDFKSFLSMGGTRSDTYKKFQGTMELLYTERLKSDLAKLIEIWTESQKYFHFLGDI
ncbi:MAG: hypothetical protein Lokiarch_01630 [Candidatus Lokiarchaeum sp. GC14_75]|nr:MAG: hypothetical protein Lokiarch_01630 [Candidatus Lokiarchaeum sp. GC14_75]